MRLEMPNAVFILPPPSPTPCVLTPLLPFTPTAHTTENALLSCFHIPGIVAEVTTKVMNIEKLGSDVMLWLLWLDAGCPTSKGADGRVL